MTGRRIVLIGEMVVDVTLQTQTASTKVRLGGVFHAARAAWAAGADYELAYFCPTYLDGEVQKMATAHGAIRATKIGNIGGCPNVMLIAEATEAGPQGYEHLLNEHIEFTFEEAKLRGLLADAVDVLILSGNFDLLPVLTVLAKTSARVHVDLGNGPSQLETLGALGRPLSTLFLSTSARLFPVLAPSLPQSVQAIIGQFTSKVILKENRGGARLFSASGALAVGSQRRDIVHSVGVGDAFDAVYVTQAATCGDEVALSYAAWVAADYAATTFPADFKRSAERTLKISPEQIVDFPAVSLPWEARSSRPIYIAAPDFDYVDRRPIDVLVECLKYHNFTPRLPVREHGQANGDMSAARKRELFDADIALLEKCDLLIAVNLYADPGTLIEIGLASAKGIPVLVYDPKEKAENVMLMHVPELVSSSLDRIITATFDIIARACHPS